MKFLSKWLKSSATSTPGTSGEESPFQNDGRPLRSSGNSSLSTIGKGRKILIVDDNKVVLKAFELKLKACGFEVCTSPDGSAAVSTARQERPDLLVLDVNFPPDVGSSGLQWDAFNIMEWMRRFQEVSNLPVIIITSSDPEKLKVRAARAGAFDFFQKPVNFEDFLISVCRALNTSETVAS